MGCCATCVKLPPPHTPQIIKNLVNIRSIIQLVEDQHLGKHELLIPPWLN